MMKIIYLAAATKENITHPPAQIKPKPITGGAAHYVLQRVTVNHVCECSSVLKISVTFLLQSPKTPALAVRYLYTQ